ncbi:MAG: calcium/sodium antiporter [Alphaproteobacteria bacterium]|nr:calcium/sodium antiporter [Alphaproteobacteria bacterium]
MPEPVIFLLLIAVGIALLLYGGDLLVRGATSLARKVGIPSLIVGLTIVAFGTSAPEMVVSAAAAIENAPGLAIGNIVGSNIANILLVLGLPAVLAPMATKMTGVKRNAVIALALTGVFIWMGFDGALTLTEGVALAVGIVLYIAYLAISARGAKDDPVIAELTDVDHMEGLPQTGVMIAVYTLAGLVLLPVGARLIVEGGVGVAELFGVPEAVIGLTILAFGTSLPELATAMVAALRKQAEMAIGNVIGSNIFNICAVGGITGIAATAATGQPAPVDPEFIRFDFWVMAGAMAVTALLVFSERPLGRLLGLVFALAYGAYLTALVAMNTSVFG